MKLYSRWQNSAGERVRIALHLKGIEYEYVPVGSLPTGAYRRLNPQGLLPALEDGGHHVAQSAAILDYLEERFPLPSLLPANPIHRAQARAFGAHIAAEMHAITVSRVRKFLHEQMSLGGAGVDRWVEHWLAEGFKALEETLAQHSSSLPFCFGETPGWADLHLVPQMAAARRLQFDVSPYRRLLVVEANCTSLDAFKRARPENQSDFPGEPN